MKKTLNQKKSPFFCVSTVFSSLIAAYLIISLKLAIAGNIEFEIYIVNPITEKRILPNSSTRLFPLTKDQKNTISVRACRGEFEPGSFVIRAATDLTGLSVISSDLKGPGGNIISREAIDIKIVKCWYQGGSGSIARGASTLTAELLLKDDTLIKIDEHNKKNFLKIREI